MAMDAVVPAECIPLKCVRNNTRNRAQIVLLQTFSCKINWFPKLAYAVHQPVACF
jgi:hypothetical protein